MKRFFIITICFLCVGLCQAQIDRKELNEFNYIHSENGFVTKEGAIKHGRIKFHYDGLYSADGKVLLKKFLNDYNAVAPGTEVIAANACAGIGNIRLLIPNTVKYISPQAFAPQPYIIVYDISEIEEDKGKDK